MPKLQHLNLSFNDLIGAHDDDDDDDLEHDDHDDVSTNVMTMALSL